MATIQHLLNSAVEHFRKTGRVSTVRRAGAAAAGLALGLFASFEASAQIGGKTAADGPFTLDNVEDLDTTAAGVARAWVPDYVFGITDPFQAVALSGSGLTLASGQSPTGALRFSMPTYYQFVDYSFGIPTPKVLGGSTLTDPGDIRSFTHLSFLVRASTTLVDQKKEVILTTYPGPDYPTLHWSYSIPAGTTFQQITVDLRQPSFILNNSTNLSVEDLLSQCRFLSFYFYGGPEVSPKTLTVHVDDVKLTGSVTTSVADWVLFE